eukprot:Lithocolla_globosa_v1_NODE_2577_length_1947_cov_14.949789.p2 type:complete len:106 gc:universal NODE_2577_length_1947_cov_14.949789:937-1254(+)
MVNSLEIIVVFGVEDSEEVMIVTAFLFFFCIHALSHFFFRKSLLIFFEGRKVRVDEVSGGELRSALLHANSCFCLAKFFQNTVCIHHVFLVLELINEASSCVIIQ